METSLVDRPQQLADALTKDLHPPTRHGEASLKDVGAATRLAGAVTWVADPAAEPTLQTEAAKGKPAPAKTKEHKPAILLHEPATRLAAQDRSHRQATRRDGLQMTFTCKPARE